jgi:EpsI family protein
MHADNQGVKNCNLMSSRRRRRRGAVPLWLAGVLAVGLLVAAGVVYRAQSSHLESLPPITLPVPLSEIPLEINGWTGQELKIAATTDEYMRANFADDYVSRRYVNAEEARWADLYVVYCSSRLAGLSGHRPRVCYPGNGWVWDETEPSEFYSVAGRRVPCLMHRFHKPPPEFREVVVLSFYVLNGEITLDEGEFSDLWGRRLNVAGDPARYVAQIQVSSALEQSARSAIGSLVDTIFAFLPDRDGNVQAAPSTREQSTDANEPLSGGESSVLGDARSDVLLGYGAGGIRHD